MNLPADDDEVLVFQSNEDGTTVTGLDALYWNILIVDDDLDIHKVTTLAFCDTLILGRRLAFSHAYTAQQAREKLQSTNHLAVVLLDVVMEEADTGLRLVKEIRESMQMSEVRIILRTGQPGYAPEIETIRDLDINDYKTKSELNRTRLYASVTSAVRSFDQISRLNAGSRGLDLIIQGSAELIRIPHLKDFASSALVQVASLLGVAPSGLVCASDGAASDFTVLAAEGVFKSCLNRPLSGLADVQVKNALLKTMQQRSNSFGANGITVFAGTSRMSLGIFLDTVVKAGEIDEKLLNVLSSNLSVCLDNVVMFSRLQKQAYFDSMVALPNRAHFLEEIDRCVASSANRDEVIAIVDVDGFAEVNDALGHRYGDLLLQAVAVRLRAGLPADIFVARVAGDVFGLFGKAAFIDPAQIVQLFQKPLTVGEDKHTVSVTIGLAMLNEVDGDAGDAFKSASIALKRAQTLNRGSFAYFSRTLGSETRDRVRLLRNLRSALDSEHLFLYYQPQVSLQDGRAVGVEALMRWRSPGGEFVAPDTFIPLAERSGLIVPIGEWVLRTACAQARQLQEAGYPRLRMAINVSSLQFRHADFLTVLDKALLDTAVDPTTIELEITESVAMLEADFVVNLINEIKARQVLLAIDDFGTGFSSLSYLQRLKIDRLKIDRSFVTQLTQKDVGKSIALTVTHLAKNLGLEVIAEGVEHPEQAIRLRAMGCDEAQGYFFARPLAVQALTDWLRDHADGRCFVSTLRPAAARDTAMKTQTG